MNGRSGVSAAIVAGLLSSLASAPPTIAATSPAISPAVVSVACAITQPVDVAVYGVDTVMIGPSEASGGNDYDLCRIRPNGSAVWTTPVAVPDVDTIGGLAVGAGGIYVAGTILAASSYSRAFVARWSLAGIAGPSAVIGATTHHSIANDVALGHDGSVFVTGSTEGPLIPIPPRPLTQNDAFVRAFDASLRVRWTDQFRGTQSSDDDPTGRPGFGSGRALAADATGLYVAGTVTGTLPGGPPIRSNADTFVRRYGLTGTTVWTRQFDLVAPGVDRAHGEAESRVEDIALGADGVHLVGSSPFLTDRDPARRQDAFHRVYDRSGAVLWSREIGGINDDLSWRVFTDAAGSVILGSAGEGLSGSAGVSSVFLARFGTTGSVDRLLEFWKGGWMIRGVDAASSAGVVRLVTAAPDDVPELEGDLPAPLPGLTLTRVDLAPPVSTTPLLRPRSGGTLVGSTLEIDATWSTTDADSGVTSTEVQRQWDGGAWVAVPTASAANSTKLAGRVGGSLRLRVRATDGAGNTSAWRYSAVTTIRGTQETSSAIVQSGRWTHVAVAPAYGGWVDASSSAGSRATFRFVGSSVALLATMAPTRGRADVYIDGVFATRTDTVATSYRLRQIVFTRSWTTAGTHTISVRVAGTTGRPRVDLDAFIVLR